MANIKKKIGTDLDVAESMRTVIREVQSISKMRWEEISKKLSSPKIGGIILSCDVLRQYARKKSSSVARERLLRVASAAVKAGLAGEKTREILSFLQNPPAEVVLFANRKFQSFNRRIGKIRSRIRREHEASARRLRDAVIELHNFGLSGPEIMYMTHSLLEVLDSNLKSTSNAGIVEAERLPCDGKPERDEEPVVIAWQVLSIQEAHRSNIFIRHRVADEVMDRHNCLRSYIEDIGPGIPECMQCRSRHSCGLKP